MSDCIVIVQFSLPKRAEKQTISGGKSTVLVYRGLAEKGLIRKDYLNGGTGTGGAYLWKTRATAEAWFTPEREEMLTEKFGTEPMLI